MADWRKRVRAGISGRQADLLDADDLVHEAVGRGLVGAVEAAELDELVAACKEDLRRVRPAPPLGCGRELPLEVVERAERLLATRGVRLVAQLLAINKDTALAIKQGRHPQQRARAKLGRCPGCGGRIASGAACGLCRVRRLKGAA